GGCSDARRHCDDTGDFLAAVRCRSADGESLSILGRRNARESENQKQQSNQAPHIRTSNFLVLLRVFVSWWQKEQPRRLKDSKKHEGPPGAKRIAKRSPLQSTNRALSSILGQEFAKLI